MEAKKPPDPPDKLFEYTPVMTVTLPNPGNDAMDAENISNRKRPAQSPPVTVINPPKVAKVNGRQCYTPNDAPPYIVHVALRDSQTSGTTLHPVKFGMFLMKNNINNVRMDGVKRLGRNKISVEFKSHQDANSFLINGVVAQHNYITSIPLFNITRMGIVRDVPVDWTEEEIVENIRVPSGCGNVIKARRMNRKVVSSDGSEWKPTQTVVLTFDGQILPKRVYCFYTALTVERYTYPTVQCFNCCRFGHTRTLCRSKPRCFRCGQDHPGDGCLVSDDIATCVNCHGNHFANSKGCPELGRQRSIKALMAEKSISYAEASQVFPTIKRSYAEVSKSLQQPKPKLPQHNNNTPQTPKSYRKTVFLKPKSHAPLTPSYDKQAHRALIHNYSFSPSQNGCAYPLEGENNRNPKNVLNLITNMLMAVLENPTQNIPDHVAVKLSNILQYIGNIPSPNIPSMEREEYSSEEN